MFLGFCPYICECHLESPVAVHIDGNFVVKSRDLAREWLSSGRWFQIRFHNSGLTWSVLSRRSDKNKIKNQFTESIGELQSPTRRGEAASAAASDISGCPRPSQRYSAVTSEEKTVWYLPLLRWLSGSYGYASPSYTRFASFNVTGNRTTLNMIRPVLVAQPLPTRPSSDFEANEIRTSLRESRCEYTKSLP